jgi:Na+/proline symporter
LNSSAAAAVADFYQPWVARTAQQPAPRRLLAVSRRFTVFFGFLQIAVGIGASHLSQSVVADALAIAGFTAGILLGVFALGLLTRSTHQRGVLVGMLIGIAVLMWVKFTTPLAWPWFAIIGATATFVSGYVASRLIPSGTRPDDIA